MDLDDRAASFRFLVRDRRNASVWWIFAAFPPPVLPTRVMIRKSDHGSPKRGDASHWRTQLNRLRAAFAAVVARVSASNFAAPRTEFLAPLRSPARAFATGSLAGQQRATERIRGDVCVNRRAIDRVVRERLFSRAEPERR